MIERLDAHECFLFSYAIHDSSGRICCNETTFRIRRIRETRLVEIGFRYDIDFGSLSVHSGRHYLYLDKFDGRFWETWYFQAELSGEGPSSLLNVTKEYALFHYREHHDKISGIK